MVNVYSTQELTSAAASKHISTPYFTLLGSLGVFAATIGITFIGAILGFIFLGKLEQTSPSLFYLLIELLTLACLYWFHARTFPYRSYNKMGFIPLVNVKKLFVVTLAYLAGEAGLSYLSPEAFIEASLVTEQMIYEAPIIASIISIVIMAPFIEELLFRQLFFVPLIEKRISAVIVIPLTSLPWALLHIQYSLFVVGVIFVFGCLLGYLRYTYNSIWAPIFSHALANFLAVCLTLFEVQL